MWLCKLDPLSLRSPLCWAWDTSLGHPSVADEASYWPKRVLRSGWLCIAYLGLLLREMWFVDCSCICGRPKRVLRSGWFCIAYLGLLLREMWFVDCSCICGRPKRVLRSGWFCITSRTTFKGDVVRWLFMHMWQSRVEITHYSVAYFDHVMFKAL